jgi:uncharacterized protein
LTPACARQVTIHGVAQAGTVALRSGIIVGARRNRLTRPDPRTVEAERGELRLLCDEMLKGIGSWLRVAGYDAAIADDGGRDDALLARAGAESRLLLTCDRRLAARAGAGTAIAVLGSERLDEAACELSARLGIDWLHAPFTRCLVDNTRLAPAAEEDLAGLPMSARQGAGPIMRCPRCGRVFWPGSHVRRMRAKLERWQARAQTRRP